MISDLLKKIDSFSKHQFLQSCLDYSSIGNSQIPIKSYIAINKNHSGKVFLIKEIMIFRNNSIADSCYDVWEFDNTGKDKKIIVSELEDDFFGNLEIVKNLE